MAIIDDVSELNENSKKNVSYCCDECGTMGKRKYIEAVISVKRYGKVLCKTCSRKVVDKERRLASYKILEQTAIEGGYKILTSFEDMGGMRDDFIIECPKHGVIVTSRKNLSRGAWCVKCSKEKALEANRDKYYEEIVDWAKRKGYSIVTKKEDISTCRTIIKYICPTHGAKQIELNCILRRKDTGCKQCSDATKNNYRKMEAGELEMIFKQYNGYLLNSQDYTNAQTKNLKTICPKCYSEFITSYYAFIKHGGQLCPNCSSKESVGEMRIRKFLELNNISFEQEKSFDDLRIVHLLRFDFYIKEYNLMVEHHGEQHYVDRSVTNVFKYSLEDNQHRDNMKRDYCTANGIDLFEIQFNNYKTIEKRLAKKLISIDPTLVLKFNDGSIMDKSIADKIKFKKDKNIYNTHKDIV